MRKLMKKKAISILLLLVIAVFLIGHSSPKMALRTHLFTIFNGNSITLLLSDIEEIEYREEDDYPGSRFFIIKDPNSRNSFANDYVWGVHKKGFLYFAYEIGKC